MLNIKKTLTKVLDYIGGLKFYDSNAVTGHEWSTAEARVLLWENASPSSAFAPQTISWAEGDYDFYEVEFTYDCTASTTHCFSYRFEAGKRTHFVFPQRAYIYSRDIPASSQSSIQFGVGATIVYINSSSANNIYGVPLKIYGIKEN